MDARELHNFFVSRGVDGDCPVCGFEGAWVRLEGDSNLKLNTPDDSGAIDVAAVLCQNCGFVRLHSIDVIRHAVVEPDEGRPDDS